MPDFSKIIAILREAQEKGVRQIKHEYVIWDKQGNPCGYCGLGVLYAASGPGILQPIEDGAVRGSELWDVIDADFRKFYGGIGASSTLLPNGKTLGEWIAIENDGGKTFGQIADALEAMLNDREWGRA